MDWSKVLLRDGGISDGGLRLYGGRSIGGVEFTQVRPGCVITVDGIRWDDLRGSGCRTELRPPDRDQVERAKLFITACCRRTVGVGRSIGSYGWKHEAERWLEKRREDALIKEDTYVSNGAFIQAAAEFGVKIVPKDDGINARLSLAYVKRMKH